MNIRVAVVACAALAVVATARAQTCSGGPEGGIDATGNQCSTPPVAEVTKAVVAASAAAPPAEGARAKPAPKHAAATRIAVALTPTSTRATGAGGRSAEAH